MTSEIQWEEDWFSVSDLRNDIHDGTGGTAGGGTAGTAGTVTAGTAGAGTGDMEDSIESIKEWIEKDIRTQEKEAKQVKSVDKVNQRMDWLERLIHHQNEIIRGLGEEVRVLMMTTGALKTELQGLRAEIQMLQGELHSTSHTSMTRLLEELKQIKERELNYALRRHQPIPFFDSRNMIRMVGSISSAHSMGSPLFRLPTQKVQVPSLHL